jgi:predicted nucleotidyltransferase
LHDDCRSDSDIDVLVVFTPDAPWALLDLVNMENELTDLTGRDIDLIGKTGY